MRHGTPGKEKLHSIRHILYFVRWIIIIGVYLESRLQFTSAHLNHMEIRVAVIVIAALTLASRWIPRKWLGKGVAVLSIIADIGFVTIVVFYSDGIQSPYYPLYYVTVISTAVVFGTNGALIAASVISLLSYTVEVHDVHGVFTRALVLEDFVRTVPYLFLIAVITGALRDRSRALAKRAANLQAKQEAIEFEMEIARKVERAQLPTNVPVMNGAEMIVYYEPAREVGGDTYDFYPVKDDCIGIAIADASGKGVPAALLVASIKYAIREHYSEDHSAMMCGINKEMLVRTTADTFVTMVFGMLNLNSWEMKLTNAGHMPPILIKGKTGDIVCYDRVEPPLGIAEINEYNEISIQLEPGDKLIFYTDGVTDALASGGRRFG